MNKSDYVGSVDSTHAKANKVFDVNQLLSLDNDDSAVNIMCKNCHSVIEGTQKAAMSLAVAAKTDLPDDLTGKYFQTSLCMFCDNTDDEVTVELKDIAELAN
ncbi:MAG: hypothetical protein NTY12_02805 [Candidatus Falkowbacteria bacterium]|nr:hypothetical protein [Candidatus Falkowbacteria bacterium]